MQATVLALFPLLTPTYFIEQSQRGIKKTMATQPNISVAPKIAWNHANAKALGVASVAAPLLANATMEVQVVGHNHRPHRAHQLDLAGKKKSAGWVEESEGRDVLVLSVTAPPQKKRTQ